eukprot:3971975-Amphidinium_carterae.1
MGSCTQFRMPGCLQLRAPIPRHMASRGADTEPQGELGCRRQPEIANVGVAQSKFSSNDFVNSSNFSMDKTKHGKQRNFLSKRTKLGTTATAAKWKQDIEKEAWQ